MHADTLAATIELQQMIARYWRELDLNEARNITDFYVEDCAFVAGAHYAYTGRAGVRAFYDARAEVVRGEKDGARTTRHTYTNLLVSAEGRDHARVSFVVTNHSGGGRPPVTDYTGPTMVADVTMDCRREPDGEWRIARFTGEPLFIGAEPFTRKVVMKDLA
jgi:ketosteroid isomerase-like protein